MSRRKHKKRKLENVKLNLAAMLDMAFQLLAFFILTFKPSPVEGQVNLRLPPAQPVTITQNGQKAGANTNNPNPLEGLKSLVISIYARTDGTIDKVVLLDATLTNLPQLEKRIHLELSQKGSIFEQVGLQIDPRLKYEELMKVVDICTRAKLPDGKPLGKLSFVEIPMN
jgi:biopolymer transport protein ExbD